MRLLITQLSRFGLVGSVGLVIDVVIFNILRTTILAPEVLHEGPVLAKVASTAVAIVANWLGNRYWTFRRTKLQHPVREGLKFGLVSLGGILIGLSCLVVSHYVLGFTSLLADNISSNVIGLVLGTVFRFWGYRTWVFVQEPLNDELSTTAAAATTVGVAAAAATTGAALGTTERAISPAGLSPLHRVQAVSPVEDRAHRND
ncbi:GtrA family protein [Salinibacterium sp. NG253]|uniref:GtrA family protein n=1 Tax=Salinibacterium sp. NG253 TaxID=2792039 RepID=UPI0018CD9CA5|nr:GtrA family protein [Salinibacterium sp. NG253]MBH0116152.1 GtrA family protein [Salinibacterium sp. NG253]